MVRSGPHKPASPLRVSPFAPARRLHPHDERVSFSALKGRGVQDGKASAASGHVPGPRGCSGGARAAHRVSVSLLQKCLRFNPDATVWVAKQRILCSLNQSLKDVLNYGLFQPASNGRDGKFLDEERLLREYPQPAGQGVPSLEVLHRGPPGKPSSGAWGSHPLGLRIAGGCARLRGLLADPRWDGLVGQESRCVRLTGPTQVHVRPGDASGARRCLPSPLSCPWARGGRWAS